MLEPTSHTFDDAQLQIYTLMQRDSYPRFMNTEVYKDLLKTVSEQPAESQTPVILAERPTFLIFSLFVVQNMFKRTPVWVFPGILLLQRSVPEKKKTLRSPGHWIFKKYVSNLLRAQHHKYCYRSAQQEAPKDYQCVLRKQSILFGLTFFYYGLL